MNMSILAVKMKTMRADWEMMQKGEMSSSCILKTVVSICVCLPSCLSVCVCLASGWNCLLLSSVAVTWSCYLLNLTYNSMLFKVS